MGRRASRDVKVTEEVTVELRRCEGANHVTILRRMFQGQECVVLSCSVMSGYLQPHGLW